jgi:hypothetical protein
MGSSWPRSRDTVPLILWDNRFIYLQPPIVWFPGDPDCGEGDLGGDGTLDAFQLIAFLLR